MIEREEVEAFTIGLEIAAGLHKDHARVSNKMCIRIATMLRALMAERDALQQRLDLAAQADKTAMAEIPKIVASARADALEEAAKRCAGNFEYCLNGKEMADAIRALANQPPAKGG